MALSPNIILIGCMGSGKSAVATELSKISDFKKIDTDNVIETKTNTKISEIFKTKGEDYFRSLETQICNQLPKLKNKVIATGGGIVLSQENRHLLKSSGLVVYLKASIPVLVKRVSNSTHRPLLQNNDTKTVLTNLLKKRDPLYEETAHHILETDIFSVQDIANKILALYNHEINWQEV